MNWISGKRNCVSFDIFDTCLIRRCGRPEKVWDLMADKLFDKDDARGRLSFVGHRRFAEGTAGQKAKDPTLEDIYEIMEVEQWGFETRDVIALELEIEERELFPNPKMLRIVNGFRAENARIAFVSDMYLPTAFVRKILEKFGFFKEGDSIFISADCKAGKYNGKLFDRVFRETGTQAKQWIHYGDNEHSDFLVPKSKGVKAVLVSDTDFTEEEQRWLDDARFYTHKHDIELWAGLCRLTRLQNEADLAATMAIDLIASVYVPYVLYVLETARRKGIGTLYFLARDSHIFLEIAKTLGTESEGIECRYLKLSRRALHQCAFYNVDGSELELTVGNAYGQTIENAAKFIGVAYDDLSGETRRKFGRDLLLNSWKRIRAFSQTLEENDRDLIKEKSRQNRELLLKYLEQERVFERPSAFVDLGWVGSCRCIVNNILNKEGHQAIPTFYWGYNNALVYGRDAGDLYVFNQQYSLVSDHPYCNLFLEEYASLNPAGSTIGYRATGHGIEAIEHMKKKTGTSLAETNERFARKVAAGIPADMLANAHFDEIFLCCGLRQLEWIQENPTGELLDFFSFVQTENYGVTQPLVRRLPVKDVAAMLVWGYPASLIWEEAALMKTFGPLAACFKKVCQYTSKTLFTHKLRGWWESKA